MKVHGRLDEVLANVTGKEDRVVSEVNLLVCCALMPQARQRDLELLGYSEDEVKARAFELSRLLSDRYASYNIPIPSLFVDIGEIHVSYGNTPEAENCLTHALEANSSKPCVVGSNPSLIFNQIALLQAKLGLNVTQLSENFSFLARFPRRFPEVAEGYRSLAMTVADCLHMSGQRYAREKELIHRSVERIRAKEEREDTYGLVARKLCMRTDAVASESEELIDMAETELLPRISDKLERIFTITQIGVSKALRGDEKSAMERFSLCRSLVGKRPSERIRYACETTLLRAFAQAGFSSEAREVASKLEKEFDELSSSGGKALRILMQGAEMRGWSFPKDLRDMADGFIEMLASHSHWIISSFILAGRYCKDNGDREYYLERAADMIKQIPIRGQTGFNLYMLLSTSHGYVGQPDRALEALQLGLEELRNAEINPAQDIFCHEVAAACSENFYLTGGDDRFVDAFLNYMGQLQIKSKKLSDASYLFLRELASLSKDYRWKITFYTSSF